MQLRDWSASLKSPSSLLQTKLAPTAATRKRAVTLHRRLFGVPISSERDRQQSRSIPICVGCGTCTTVCPRRALTYAYPRASEQGSRSRPCSALTPAAAAKIAALLLAARQEVACACWAIWGVRRNWTARPKVVPMACRSVLPIALWHTSSLGLEVWLTAVAYALAGLGVDDRRRSAAITMRRFAARWRCASHSDGAGLPGRAFRMLHARDARDLARWTAICGRSAQCVSRSAGFAVQSDNGPRWNWHWII